MKWITRERPKIDRLACPWLIKRFIDKKAGILYVPFDKVKEEAQRLGAIPFDVPGVEHTHYADKCTFDYFLEKYELDDPALETIALIVRGADTDRHDLASQASGLWAISAGLSYNIKDDYQLLETAMVLYDGLYSWAKHMQNIKHTQAPSEHLLMDVYRRFLKQQSDKKKTPQWVKELKAIIQDQIDSSFTLNDISRVLDINPSYLSREFSKYFDNTGFGDYIQKMRIDKAVEIMQTTPYSLTEIAYFTGFSDQSHFSRIFKKHTGERPSDFRKKMAKK